MISGDSMTASLEDNYSDLCIAALESIKGFHKKTGLNFDQMIELKLFDQYTKTCLWTAKARKGIKLTDKMPFRNKHWSIDQLREDLNGEFDIPDTSSLCRYSGVDFVEDNLKRSEMEKQFMSLINSDPELVTSEGSIKVGPVAKTLGISVSDVNKIIKKLRKHNELG